MTPGVEVATFETGSSRSRPIASPIGGAISAAKKILFGRIVGPRAVCRPCPHSAQRRVTTLVPITLGGRPVTRLGSGEAPARSGFLRRVSDGTRTRDRLDHNPAARRRSFCTRRTRDFRPADKMESNWSHDPTRAACRQRRHPRICGGFVSSGGGIRTRDLGKVRGLRITRYPVTERIRPHQLPSRTTALTRSPRRSSLAASRTSPRTTSPSASTLGSMSRRVIVSP
jgi:hypothetical protein